MGAMRLGKFAKYLLAEGHDPSGLDPERQPTAPDPPARDAARAHPHHGLARRQRAARQPGQAAQSLDRQGDWVGAGACRGGHRRGFDRRGIERRGIDRRGIDRGPVGRPARAPGRALHGPVQFPGLANRLAALRPVRRQTHPAPLDPRPDLRQRPAIHHADRRPPVAPVHPGPLGRGVARPLDRRPLFPAAGLAPGRGGEARAPYPVDGARADHRVAAMGRVLRGKVRQAGPGGLQRLRSG